LSADGQPVAKVSREELAAGLDLLNYPEFPTVKRAGEVFQLVLQLRPATGDEARRLRAQARELCKPRAVDVRLTPQV